jgi:hypothetical protein
MHDSDDENAALNALKDQPEGTMIKILAIKTFSTANSAKRPSTLLNFQSSKTYLELPIHFRNLLQYAGFGL